MTKWIKYLLSALAIVLLLFVITILFVQIRGIPTYEYKEIPFTVRSDSNKIALGYKLALAVCNGCHLNPEDQRLSGHFLKSMGPDFGDIYSANITQDPDVGIGSWSDNELAYFLRTGVRKDGSFAPPYMPKFPLLADEDLEAIIVYLRSDHPTVAPSSRQVEKTRPNFLIKMLCNFFIKPYAYPDEILIKPSASNELAYGKYLATAQLGCFDCHSADFTKNNALIPEQSEGFFGGGNKIYDRNGNWHYSANITFDPTGIAHYSKEDFIIAVRQGLKPDKTPMNMGMPPYSMLDDAEIGTIYTYLKTVPKVQNEVLVESQK